MTDHDLPWLPLWVHDFTNSDAVAGMTMEEVGVYILLLCREWMGGPLRDDPEHWGRVIRADPNIVRTTLERCFHVVDGMWENERLEDVRAEQIKKLERYRMAGRASGRARRKSSNNNKKERRSNDVQASFEHQSNSTESKSESEAEKEEDRTNEKAVSQPNEDEIEMNDAETLRLLPRPALAVLGDLKHLGGKKATARTLVACYLYEDEGDAMPDQWIKGVESLEERVDIVARALIEYGSQNDTFNAAHFRGFVKRVRNAPKPETEAARVAKRGDPGRRQQYQGETRKPSELARISAEEFAKLAGVEVPASKRKPEEKSSAA